MGLTVAVTRKDAYTFMETLKKVPILLILTISDFNFRINCQLEGQMVQLEAQMG